MRLTLDLLFVRRQPNCLPALAGYRARRVRESRLHDEIRCRSATIQVGTNSEAG